MEFWGRHRHVMSKGSNWWESVKIGGGAAPIETSEGWLLFYHGVTGTCNGFVYSIGGAILDKDEPSKVLYRCGNFLLTPGKGGMRSVASCPTSASPAPPCRMPTPAASLCTMAAPTAMSVWPSPP